MASSTLASGNPSEIIAPVAELVDARDLKSLGRKAMNVWGTWCGECRVEHEALLAIARKNRVPIVGLNWRDDDAAALEWLSQLGNPYSVVAVDGQGNTAIDYGVYGAPETFFVDANGLIQYRHVGAMTPEVWDREFASRLPRGELP